MGKVVTVWESVKEKEMKETKILWERAFDQSYEKAGGEVVLDLDRVNLVKAPVYRCQHQIQVHATKVY